MRKAIVNRQSSIVNRQSSIVNRLSAAWQALTRPPAGRVYRYDPQLDQARTALTRGLTLTRLDALLRAGDEGDITETLQLFEEIERGDARVFSVAGTRRRALTGLDYEVVSAADKQPDRVDKTLADEAAAYVRERLDWIDAHRRDRADRGGQIDGGFAGGLKHLANAIGPNLAVLEAVWEYGELVDLTPIPSWRLTMKPTESLDVRILTAEQRSYGVIAASPKFVVHIPNGMSGSPLDRSIHRAQAIIWLLKKLALLDWGAFCELFGMPVRVGKYEHSTTDTERTALKNMLENMGTRGWAMVSGAMQIEFVESTQRGVAPYEAMIGALNRETGILWLGGNLPSDTTGGTGTYAAASVQDDVREDLRDADLEAEAQTVREQIFAPMVRYHWPGREVPVPYLERTVPGDSLQLAARVRAWQATGLSIPEAWARAQSGIPEPSDGERTLEAPDAFEAGMTEGMPGGYGEEATGRAEAAPPNVNELTLGIERLLRAGDTDAVRKLRAVLDRVLGGQM